MPSDKLTFLEELSNVLAGQSATAGAKALGEGIGHVYYGGEFGEMPEVMREAVERHRAASAAPKLKSKQDALELASALAAMSNPVSLAGHAVDFASAIPSMVEQKLSGQPLPTGEVMQSGLKRRLAKGGAQAEFAVQNQLQRAKQNIQNRGLMKYEPEAFLPLSSKGAKWGPGEGKFQSIEDYGSSAFDLSQKPLNPRDIGMGLKGDDVVITGHPHALGIEFEQMHGLDPQYRDKGYAKQIYQNMADVYGGGISDTGSTTPQARNVYQSLEAIPTNLESGFGFRQVIAPSEVKADPKKLKKFNKDVKEYVRKKQKPKTLDEMLSDMDDYDAQSVYDELIDQASAKGKIDARDLATLMRSLTGDDYTAQNMPKTLDLGESIWEKIGQTYKKRKP